MFKSYAIAAASFVLVDDKYKYNVCLIDDTINPINDEWCYRGTVTAYCIGQAIIKAIKEYYKDNAAYNIYLYLELCAKYDFIHPLDDEYSLEEMIDYLPTIKKLLLFT